ncbi:MAG: LptF/LptG family permease [Firmicutes bacterium]|nr:LptF/LptG family permease [Bacillota bacterium]
MRAVRAVGILDRYTAREFLGPFMVCIMGFGVILASGLLFDLADLLFLKRVAVRVVLQLLIYKVPAIVVITLPIAVLFGTLLSLGRLSKDSEMTVMRGSGVSFRRIILPFVMFGTIVSLTTYVLNEWVTPVYNHRFESILRKLTLQDPVLFLEANVFFREAGDRVIYVGEADRKTGRMRDVMIYELNPGSFPRLITARRGTYEGGVWNLEDVMVKVLDEDGFISSEASSATMRVGLEKNTEEYFGEQKTTDEMSRKELGEQIRLFQRSGVAVRRMVVDFHLKLALPFASLLFALVGAPLSLRSARAGHFFGVTMSLAVTFAYFVAMSVARSLGSNGVLPELASAWAPNALFGAAGIALICGADRST